MILYPFLPVAGNSKYFPALDSSLCFPGPGLLSLTTHLRGHRFKFKFVNKLPCVYIYWYGEMILASVKEANKWSVGSKYFHLHTCVEAEWSQMCFF